MECKSFSHFKGLKLSRYRTKLFLSSFNLQLVIHSVLKSGVYKPMRKLGFGSVVASLAVFISSGLFHEWMVHFVLLYGNHPSLSQDVLLGSNTKFFLWNFGLVVAESLLSASPKVMKHTKKVSLPTSLIGFLVVMTAAPAGHWFTGPYIKGNFFLDYEATLPLIRKL